MRWLAVQLDIHEALLSHACKGRRTIPGDVARRIVTLIGVPFDALFKSPDDTSLLPKREEIAVAS